VFQMDNYLGDGPMSLTLYFHPLASFCHKVLIAAYERETPLQMQIVDLADPASSAPMLAHWPLGKFPVLHDASNGRTVPETTIIIEYLEKNYPGAQALLPANEDERLEARLWDRFFDCYVQVPMQKIVGDRLKPEGAKDPRGVEEARQTLSTAYQTIEDKGLTGECAAGPRFSIADCSAAPALFYSSIVHPIEPRHEKLSAYFERLMSRPSVARVVKEAQPYFSMFPFADAIPARFRAA
jgi:glutathione S-transferase